LKLLHIIPSLDPAGGGPMEGLRNLAPVMSEYGHATAVVTLDAPGSPWLADFPATVFALGPAVGSYRYSRRLLPWLRRHAAEYDAVIVRGLWQYHSFGAWQALRHSSTPYLLFTHGMLDPWFKRAYPLKHLKKWLYWPWAEYRVLRDARAVLFTSEEERVLARQSFWLYRCREVVVNYGTADPPGDAEAQRAAFLAQYPELRGKRIALFLSRIHEKKGCDLLIEAFARELAADPDWRLVIAGPDQTGWRARLETMAVALGLADRIVWPGMVRGDMKWGAFRAAEVFVLPSHQENFGIVVAEALACGVPALVSNKVNIWREVQADQAGLVSPDDLEGTCSLLRTWNGMSGEEHRAYAANARRSFESRFEIHRSAQAVAQAVAAVVKP
jgi:glycosyltransferase involved in cell wall biosynthesis